MASTTPSSNAVCAHDECSCVVAGQSDAVQRDGFTYCSEGCARGSGCEHETCGCVDKAYGDASGTTP
ncbi:MAG: metallothionein [Pirellulaceae bacterium]